MALGNRKQKPVAKKKKAAAKKKSTVTKKPSAKAGAGLRPDLSKIAQAFDKTKRGNFWKMGDGRNRIRVLPFMLNDEIAVWGEQRTHFKPTPEINSLICPGADCPLCNLARDVEVKDLFSRTQYVMIVIPVEEESPSPQIYRAPKTVMDKIMKTVLDPDYKDVLDLKKGRDFIVTKTGAGKKTRYEVVPAARPTAVTVQGTIPDVGKIVNVKADMDQLQKAADELEEQYS